MRSLRPALTAGCCNHQYRVETREETQRRAPAGPCGFRMEARRSTCFASQHDHRRRHIDLQPPLTLSGRMRTILQRLRRHARLLHPRTHQASASYHPVFFGYVRARRYEIAGTSEDTQLGSLPEDNWQVTTTPADQCRCLAATVSTQGGDGRELHQNDKWCAPRLVFPST